MKVKVSSPVHLNITQFRLNITQVSMNTTQVCLNNAPVACLRLALNDANCNTIQLKSLTTLCRMNFTLSLHFPSLCSLQSAFYTERILVATKHAIYQLNFASKGTVIYSSARLMSFTSNLHLASNCPLH